MTDTSHLVLAAAAGSPATASRAERTIAGRVVPFGPAGETSFGRLTFAAGSITLPEDPRRVKLLVEHDQRAVVGHAIGFEERADGLYATFNVPETPAGDEAITLAEAGLRDAFSVGTQLDDATVTKLYRTERGGTVPARGALREVSLVSVPAFDDARIESVAAAAGALVVSAWSDSAVPSTEGKDMPDTATVDAPDLATASSPDTTGAAASPLSPAPVVSGPTTINAVAGAAAHVTGEAATYSFDGTGPSLIRDAWSARMHGDGEAGQRVARFNAELAANNPASTLALAAVAVSDPVPDGFFKSPTARTNLVNLALDRARPLASRLATVNITDATPFVVPQTGEFSAVGDHVEGTPHVAEGALTLDDAIVRPRAVSGAWRVSRELVESTNPALDRIAVAAMVRDYRRHSEAKIVAGLVAAKPTADATGITTSMDVRAEIVDFSAEDDEVADFLVAGRTFYATLAGEVDADGRAMLPTAGPVNALGTLKAGSTGATIDGVEVARASSLAAADAWLIRADDVLFAESAVKTFRFEEPEGPGIIKLALWAYVASAVLNTGGVRRLSSAA